MFVFVADGAKLMRIARFIASYSNPNGICIAAGWMRARRERLSLFPRVLLVVKYVTVKAVLFCSSLQTADAPAPRSRQVTANLYSGTTFALQPTSGYRYNQAYNHASMHGETHGTRPTYAHSLYGSQLRMSTYSRA